MPRIEIEGAPTSFSNAYPPPLDGPGKELRRWKLGAPLA
jgi:hypothetical protein